MKRHFTSVLKLVIAASALAIPLAVPGSVDAAGKVSVIAVPEGGEPLSAKTDSSGAVHLLMNTPDGPKYAKSTDNGRTFQKLIPVLDRASRKPNLEYSAEDLAVTSDGHVHVAMGTNAYKLKLPEEEWGCYYSRLSPGADAFSPVRNINRKPSEGFSLAADDTGRVTACWLSGKLYANISRDGGQTFDETVEIDPSFDPCNCCTTSCVYGTDGRLAVLYREKTNNERDMHLVLWNQEQNQVSRTRVSSTSWKIDACPMTYYSIVANGKGYLAVWRRRVRSISPVLIPAAN